MPDRTIPLCAILLFCRFQLLCFFPCSNGFPIGDSLIRLEPPCMLFIRQLHQLVFQNPLCGLLCRFIIQADVLIRCICRNRNHCARRDLSDLGRTLFFHPHILRDIHSRSIFHNRHTHQRTVFFRQSIRFGRIRGRVIPANVGWHRRSVRSYRSCPNARMCFGTGAFFVFSCPAARAKRPERKTP